jgi:hypothetical protein
MRKQLMLRWGIVAFITMIAIVWLTIYLLRKTPGAYLACYGEKNDDSTEHEIADWKFDQNGQLYLRKILMIKFVADFSLLLAREFVQKCQLKWKSCKTI